MPINQQVIENIFKEIEVIKELEKNHNKVNIVNAGLLKAGKSELFNAISGTQNFETGVVRTTIENTKLELENYNLIDTPGLDANFEDSKMAFEGYKEADIVTFVHNAVDGELNKIEIDSIKEIIKLFDDKKIFFNSSILVITHVDQLENEAQKEKILCVINDQIKDIFGESFLYIIGVDSMACIKGMKESKKLLVNSSNISNLKLMLEEMIKNGKSCFGDIINKSKLSCNKNIDYVINLLQKEEQSIKIESQTQNIQEIKNKIENIKIKSNSYSKTMPKKGFVSMYKGNYCSYTKYKSSSSARSAAEKACREVIRRAASLARNEGLSAISSYEQESKNCKTLNLKLMEDFNEIKRVYYKIDKTKSISNLSFESSEMSRHDEEIIKICKERVKYIEESTFRSPNSYFNAYSSNLYIEKDYDEEYVNGIFGGRWKQVAYYTWDIEGSIDDICSDYKDILEERTREAYELYNKTYLKNAEQMLQQYKLEVDKIIASLSIILSKVSEENNKKYKAKEEIKSKIRQLEIQKQYLV